LWRDCGGEKRRSDRLRPFDGERIDATDTAGNESSERICGVKAIELRLQGGAIGVVAAAANQNPHCPTSLLV
jgi:hypothetical protein